MTFFAHLAAGLYLFFGGIWTSIFGAPVPTSHEAFPPDAVHAVHALAPSYLQLTKPSTATGTIQSQQSLPARWGPAKGGFSVSSTGTEIPIPAPAGLLQSTRDSSFTKNSQEVFYLGHAIANADSSTFQVLSNKTSPVSFGRDTNRIYCGEDGVAQALVNADPNSFSVVIDIEGSESGYATDTSNVYAGCDSIISNADPTSFVALGPYDMDGGYAKDATHVWYVSRPLAR